MKTIWEKATNSMRNSRQRERAMRRKFRKMAGIVGAADGFPVTLLGAGIFKDDEDCPDGLGLDFMCGDKPVRLFVKIEDCLLLEYVIQEARREHPVFFN